MLLIKFEFFIATSENLILIPSSDLLFIKLELFIKTFAECIDICPEK